MNGNRVKKSVVLIFVLMKIAQAGTVLAAETTMIVELQRRIKDNVTQLQSTKQKMEESAAELQNEAEQTKNEFSSTANRDDRQFLVKRYIAVHAKALRSTAENVKEMQGSIDNLMTDMEQLQQVLKRSGRNGVSADSDQDMALAGELMSGYMASFKTLLAFDPENKDLASLSKKISRQDALLRKTFKRRKNFNIEEQIDRLADMHAALELGMQLIDAERVNLQQVSYLVLQGEIADSVYMIDANITPIYNNILNGDSTLDNMLEQLEVSSMDQRRYEVIENLDHVGNYSR